MQHQALKNGLKWLQAHENTGAPDKVRTRDPLITNQVLYQLSYKGNPVVPN